MSTEDEQAQAFRDRAAQMTDAELVRAMYLFDHLRGVEAGLVAITEVLAPGAAIPPDPYANLTPADIGALLRAELKKRNDEKGQGAS